MRYRVTLPNESGYTARSHYGIGTFIVDEPREVDLTPDLAESLRVKGYAVELIVDDPIPHAPRVKPTRKSHEVLPEKNDMED